MIPNPYGPGFEDWGYTSDEGDVLDDTREGCPECDEGRIVVTGYDGVNNAWDAHCSNHCGWTS